MAHRPSLSLSLSFSLLFLFLSAEFGFVNELESVRDGVINDGFIRLTVHNIVKPKLKTISKKYFLHQRKRQSTYRRTEEQFDVQHVNICTVSSINITTGDDYYTTNVDGYNFPLLFKFDSVMQKWCTGYGLQRYNNIIVSSPLCAERTK